MRAPVLILLLVAGAAGGCGLLWPGVTGVFVESVRVDALDLSQPWDSPITNDKPDVYVAIFQNSVSFLPTPKIRTRVVDNVEAGDLPLVFSGFDRERLDLDDPVGVRVVDEDSIGDDVMYHAEAFVFEDHLPPDAERGEPGQVVLEGPEGRVVLSVRWD